MLPDVIFVMNMMGNSPLEIKGALSFRIRFNTLHGDTDLYWRLLVSGSEYLVSTIECRVPTCTDRSYDTNAGAVKFHIAGTCTEMKITENHHAILQ